MIFIDECDFVIRYYRFPPTFPSRHEIITVTIDVFHSTTNNETYTYTCINKITSQDLNSYLHNQDWSIFASDNTFDVEQGLAILTDNLQKAINSLAPDKKFKKKNLYPWIDTELKLLISKRDATCRRYLTNILPWST